MIKDNKTVGKTNKYIYNIQVAVEEANDINFIGHLLSKYDVQVLGCSFMKWTQTPNTVHITDMIDYVGTRFGVKPSATDEVAGDSDD
jgi:hypothetical protein